MNMSFERHELLHIGLLVWSNGSFVERGKGAGKHDWIGRLGECLNF